MPNITDTSTSVLRNYGPFDPLTSSYDHLNSCKCGSALTKADVKNDTPKPEQMGLPKEAIIKVRRFFVQCPNCKGVGPATKSPLYAVLQWNISDLSLKTSHTELPLFNVSSMTKEEAHQRLLAIRDDLKIRIAECEERLANEDVSKHPGPRYKAKLEAYRSWVYYAIMITR